MVINEHVYVSFNLLETWLHDDTWSEGGKDGVLSKCWSFCVFPLRFHFFGEEDSFVEDNAWVWSSYLESETADTN